jgi:hypothetical protein
MEKVWHTLRVGHKNTVGGLKMIKHLTVKTKRKLKYLHVRTCRGIKRAARRLRLYFFDPNDSAPGDDFPSGPLHFLMPKT